METSRGVPLYIFIVLLCGASVFALVISSSESPLDSSKKQDDQKRELIRKNVYSVKNHIYRERCLNGVVYYLFHRGASIAKTPDNTVRHCSGQRTLYMYDHDSLMQVLVKDVWTSYDVMIPDKDLENEEGFTKIAKGSFEWRLNNVSQGIGQPGTYYTINSDH